MAVTSSVKMDRRKVDSQVSGLTEMQLRAINLLIWVDRDAALRCAAIAARLRQSYSSIPWHANRAAKNPDYWLLFAAGQPNS